MMTATIELRLYCDNDRCFFPPRRDPDGSKAKDRPVLLDTIATHRDAADRMVVRRGLYLNVERCAKFFEYGDNAIFTLSDPRGGIKHIGFYVRWCGAGESMPLIYV